MQRRDWEANLRGKDGEKVSDALSEKERSRSNAKTHSTWIAFWTVESVSTSTDEVASSYQPGNVGESGRQIKDWERRRARRT